MKLAVSKYELCEIRLRNKDSYIETTIRGGCMSSMTKGFVFVLIFSTGGFSQKVFAYANENDLSIESTQDPTNSSLKQNMKKIGNLFKTLGSAVSDPTLNAESAQNADQLTALFIEAQSMIPDSIASLSGVEQNAAISDYKSMLQSEADLSKRLSAAFKKNDNNGASALLNQINNLKKDGHNKYK